MKNKLKMFSVAKVDVNIERVTRRVLCIMLLLCISGVVTAQIAHAWSASTGGSTNEENTASVRDDDGNLYLTGNFFSTSDFDPSSATANLSSVGGSPDVYVAKYDGNGNYKWAIHMGGSMPSYGQGIDVDSSGNVYVTGYFHGTVDFDPSPSAANLTASGQIDIFLAKYDSSGNYQWAFGLGGSSVDFAYSVTTDRGGNSYITGYFLGNVDFDPSSSTAPLSSTGGSPDAYLAKYDASGNYVWAGKIGGNAYDQGNKVILDEPETSLYLTGFFQSTADFDLSGNTANITSTAGSKDGFIAAYDTSGAYQWAHELGGSSPDESNVLAAHGSGYVYVSGVFQGTANFDPSGTSPALTSAGNDDIFLARFDASGNYSWSIALGDTLQDRPYDAKVDSNGGVWLTGAFRDTVQFDTSGMAAPLGSAGSGDIFIAGYDTAAAFIDVAGFGAFGDDKGASLMLNENDGMYLTGTFSNTVDFDPGIDSAKHTATGADLFMAEYFRCIPQPYNITDTICTYDTYAFGSQTLDSAGTYAETFPTVSGCDSLVVLTLKTDQPDTSVSKSGTILTAGNAVSYQWLNCDNTALVGETSQVFNPSQNGSYKVAVVSGFGCLDTSSCVQVSSVGIEEQEVQNKIGVFPNPSQGRFSLVLPEGELVLGLYTKTGRLIRNEKLRETAQRKLEIKELPAGVYYLKVRGKAINESVQVVVVQ